MASPGEPVRLKQLNHSFGALEVLRDINLDIPAGAFVSIVGPSGCGKSTALRVLAGLQKPSSGDAQIANESTIDRPGLSAFMPQKDLLLPWRRAMDNAIVGAEIAGESKKVARERAFRLFGRFGLEGFEDAWPSELSGGMRQRLALLRTFLHPAPVLLLDEPFGALDAITRREMQQWLQSVWLQDARTVILVTHDVEEALILSETVYVMSHRPGRIVARVDVPEPRPRLTSYTTTERFLALKRELLEALDNRE